ncbi:MAG: histidinol dehydrogenase [Chitinivibrionales bacterium]|nr:histidinol dehydrogenase [Chitinivibrionales bacterium]
MHLPAVVCYFSKLTIEEPLMKFKPHIPILPYPGKQAKRILEGLSASAIDDDSTLARNVRKIVNSIRAEGDAALFDCIKAYDGRATARTTLRAKPAYIRRQAAKVSPDLEKTIKASARRIKEFHRLQQPASFTFAAREGKLTQSVTPLSSAGVYIPGGYTVYPSSVLMNVIPARIAGVARIAAVTPPRNELDPGIACALQLLDVDEVYLMGGAHAIAALAYGTQSVPSVDKIVGPGNAFVACAKKQVFGRVDIDSIAGPSEVVVVVDTSVKPEWVAHDLLAQAEHGSGDETALCITESQSVAHAIQAALCTEIERSPVKDIFGRLSENALAIFVTPDRRTSLDLVNLCAPEHLQVMTRTCRSDVKHITNAGAIFLGAHTPVALGDYYIGTNHVLPTGRAARYASALGVEDFVKRTSIARLSATELKRAAPHVSVFARAEKFVHHAMSVERRAGIDSPDQP